MIRTTPKMPQQKKIILSQKPNFDFFEEDIYTENGIDAFSESDEISLEEEAFMKGYLAA